MLRGDDTYLPESFQLGEHPLSVVGMQAYSLPLCLCKWSRLVPDRVGDTNTTQVVEPPCSSQGLYVGLWQPTVLCCLCRKLGHPARVADGVGGFQINEVSNRPQGPVKVRSGKIGMRTRFSSEHRFPQRR